LSEIETSKFGNVEEMAISNANKKAPWEACIKTCNAKDPD
jgi:hypothetical protein